MKELESCTLCPRNCKVNRNKGEVGLCGMSQEIKVARIALHYGEEPPISGTNGSGTIFFSGCNLKCIFCQNHKISIKNFGKAITVVDLADKMLELERKNAHNINLVTPTHFIPQIRDALIIAKKKGLKIPIVYNSSGYETKESIKLLDGLVDIYLPDLKYYDNFIAMRYSKAPNYFQIATEVIEEMYNQVGLPKFDKNGIMQKGLIVRHLLLPGKIEDAKKIIKYLYEKYNDRIFISIMNQYTPMEQIRSIEELNKTVTKQEYAKLISYACNLNIKNAFIQEGNTEGIEQIPAFDLTGVS